MKVLLLITISILILQVNCISSRKLLLQASYVSGFDDRYQPSDAVGTYDSYSLFECVKTCSRNIKCNFFFFNKGDNKCMLHSLPFWNTLPSTYQKGWKSYRAESTNGRCPASQNLYYNRELDFCFRFFNPVSMNFDTKVKPKCTSEGLELVRVDSAKKNQYIMQVLPGFFGPGTHICIQGTNSLTGSYSTWTFDDRTPMPYFNWDKTYKPSQPENRAGEPCIAIARSPGTWHDFSRNIGSLSCYVVCEKRL